MDDPIVRAGRWRDRAEELRTLADSVSTASARDGYLRMAKAYDQLADQWAKRAEAARAAKAQAKQPKSRS